MKGFRRTIFLTLAITLAACIQFNDGNQGSAGDTQSSASDSLVLRNKNLNQPGNSDTIGYGKCELVGEFSSLAYFDRHDFQLRYTKDFPAYKFRYMVNPNVDRTMWDSLGEMVLIGIIGIYTNDSWKVYQDYFIEIDSVLSLQVNDRGNPEIFIYSSPSWDTYFSSSGSGWTESQSALKVIDIDSNNVLLDVISDYEHRTWSNDESPGNFELKCSCNLNFSPGILIVNNYLSSFEGEEDEIDPEDKTPPCPPNGKYILMENFYTRE
ncbi:MAG: hypothetical protein GC180_12625 [Bacteroidetes bacterium]|nr:hypothetical protein [Bacteroidota bacterium]